MKCCGNCFQDEKLKELVLSYSTESGTCPFCLSEGIFLANTHDIGKFISPIIDLYTESQEPSALSIWDCLQKDWNMFSDFVNNKMVLCDNMFFNLASKSYKGLREKTFSSYYHEIEKVSSAYSASWEAFSDEIKYKNRFFYNQEVLNLSSLQRLMQYLSIPLEDDQDFFRARRSKQGETFSRDSLGAPPPHLTKSGRANPIGIPYLYLSSNESTAISEVRPIVGEKIAVGKFQISKRVEIVDLRNISVFNFIGSDGFSESIKYVNFLNGLANKMSEPIRRDSEFIDYLPTQYLSEFVKNCGWAGFYFRSSQGNGFNLTLFDPSLGICDSFVEHKVDGVKYEHQKLPA